MRDEDKIREQLLQELVEARRRIAELESTAGKDEGVGTASPAEAVMFRSFYTNAPVGCQILDHDGRLVSVNEEWSGLLGYTREEALGRPFEAYLAPGQAESFRDRLADHGEVGALRGIELNVVRKNGSMVTMSLDCAAVTDQQSGKPLFFCVLRDITEKKRVDQAIQRAKWEWEHTFDAVPDLVAILDERFRIVRLNKAMADRLGMDVRQLVGKICYQVVHGAGAPPHLCPHKRLWADGVEHAGEFHEPRLGGTFMVTASPIRDESGSLIGSVHVARDITDRKLAEQALRRAHDELEMRVIERTVELAAANDLLQEKIRTIDQLYEHVVLSGKAEAIAEHTAEVAHELRQPLAIIGGFARRIARRRQLRDPKDGEAQEDFSYIIKEVERLERILGGLIDFNRRETIGLKCANPNKLIEHVLKVNTLRFQEKNLRVSADLNEQVGEILLDPERFQHVIRNLVANAIEASPAFDAVYVESGLSRPSDKARETGHLKSETYFVMKIRNHGDVIPNHELEKVFNPFFTTKNCGTGLGLTVSKKIVEYHGGSISVKSDETGTVFTVWLPVEHHETY